MKITEIKNKITIENKLQKECFEILESEFDYEYENLKNLINTLIYDTSCENGCIGALTYYNDTEKFFDEYSDEIFELYNELKEEFGDCLDFKLSKNNLAWFGFEETISFWIRELEDELYDN